MYFYGAQGTPDVRNPDFKHTLPSALHKDSVAWAAWGPGIHWDIIPKMENQTEKGRETAARGVYRGCCCGYYKACMTLVYSNTITPKV